MNDFKNISIIGVGLIGGSFALALKKRGFRGRITGIGRNEQNLISAKDQGIIDTYSTDHTRGTEEADLVLLAAPVGQFEEITRKIIKGVKKGAIITDVGSVKAGIISKIGPLVPEGVHFIAGHPIAGKECSGIEAADPGLFENARCIITPANDSDKKALNSVRGLWESIGAKVLIMTPDEHDKVFAAVSHFPHVIAYALVNSISDTGEDILQHGGSGLRDMTRIALSPAELWQDICKENRENLMNTFRQFSSSLSKITGLIESSDWEGLRKEFKRAREARDSIESD